MYARIYRPAKTAMQSGKAKCGGWVLEFDRQRAMKIDPLMGWTSGNDMLASQVRLKFDSREAAVAYAKDKGIPHQVIDREEATPVLKSYGDNFAFQRRAPWTH